MNRLHLVTQENGRRGARTRAKERLYNFILERLRPLGVKNVGITTGKRAGMQSLWLDPIRLWRLEPQGSEVDVKWAKKNREMKKAP
ncbi:MAG: hypothetical protein ABSE73_24625 [Planctomycetota bacterium]